MATPWCVKVTCLSQGSGSDELANKFGVDRSTIDIPRNQQGPNYYAYVNGFPSEQQANLFVKKWSNQRIGTATIRCKVSQTKPHVMQNRPPSLVRNTDSRSIQNGSQRPFANTTRAQSVGPQRILTSMMSNTSNENDESDDDNRRLGKMSTRLSRLPNAAAHHFETQASFNKHEDEKTIPTDNGTNATGISKARRPNSLRSSRILSCRYGLSCFKANCLSDHPSGWYVCKVGVDCKDFNCKGNHAPPRTKPCLLDDKCTDSECPLLHPSTRVSPCSLGDQCRAFDCQHLHSSNRPNLCSFKQQCYNFDCPHLHPSDRQLCPSGVECVKFACELIHPAGRIGICKQGNACGNYYCMDLHSVEWDPCEIGKNCMNPNCRHTAHPPDRILSFHLTTSSRTFQVQAQKKLKSRQQRNIERQQTSLPILAFKDEFCRRLKQQRILIVRAETGSGKSTQLPQYAAEYFGGLVVCTQPRVVAAISLARRVANEYDGTSVGESIGYQVGTGSENKENNRIPGRDIMFMTDFALVQESQRDPQLSKIKVLIIDEAHERSMNTDIVIGLAKLFLNARRTDFYVVIASATIDPSQFLTFFNQTNIAVLDVPGRVFDVTVEYIPKPNDSTENHEVATALKLCKERSQGHILVFLSGQGEIEKAIELFNRDIPDNCVALPLYGSLSPEEQDRVLQFDEDPTGSRRMVVFCTNVAETSLTIKNVRVVIDSGWAKEARFDPQRRLTIIEMIRISKSSAEQRKGRAGRTASGHCVRLYSEDELTRPNIEPEILRSSLDRVVLQLLRLRLKPSEFPFMNTPDYATLQKSLQLLRELDCIDTKGVITLRGELFAELGFDPRLSAFIVDTYMHHQPILELSATIVAILTAPGFLFFMGGTTKEEKLAARGRVAKGAQEHNSDLLYFISVYKQWQKIGSLDAKTRHCLTCQTLNKRFDACRSCRVAYTIENRLNNKILNITEITSNNAIKIITDNRWQMKPARSLLASENDIIADYLFKHFPEQHGYILVPHLPTEGVCMILNNLRARITHTSVFVQRRIGNSHFIAMSITKLSTGDYVVERLHPFNPRTNPRLNELKQLHSISNVGWEWNFEMRKQINRLPIENWNKWLVCEYDRQLCKLIIWGQTESQEHLLQVFSPIEQTTRASLLAYTNSIICGSIQATFQSGLFCSKIENLHLTNDNTKNRLDLQHIPCKTFEELDQWLSSVLQVHLKDIRENNFQTCKGIVNTDDDYEAPPFFVVFKSEDVFKKVLSKIPPFHICSQQLESTNVLNMNEKDTWGRQLLFKVTDDQFYSEKDILTQFGQKIISCKQLGKKLLPGLQLNNMPAGVNETYVQNVLGRDLNWARINIRHSDTTNCNLGSSSAHVCFNTQQECNEAQRRLNSNDFQRAHTIIINTKTRQQHRELSVQPTVEILKIEPQTFLCIARNRQEAINIYSESSSFLIDGSASVTVAHSELYSYFDQLLKSICERFHVQMEKKPLPSKKENSTVVRCIFTGASPPKTAMAASMLRQATSPIIIKLADDRQKCLFNELFDEGIIEKWTKELQLSCTQEDKYKTVIEIYGPQIQQGQFMRRIADYSDTFDRRYRVLDLSPEAIGYFGRHKAADVKLQEFNAKWTTEGCTVTFVRRTSSILLHARPQVSSEKLDTLEKEVKKLLDTLMIAETDDDTSLEQYDFARQCAFCKQTMVSTRIFRICGHAYCRCALNVLNRIPMQCPTCQFRIHIQNIQEIFSNNRAQFINLCKSSIQTYLLSSTNSRDNDQLFCPNEECNGLVMRSKGYQTCLTCGQNVCGQCRLIDDDLHEGRTCAERSQAQQHQGEFLPRLFEEAERFTRNNWSLDLPPIVRFDRNPYLKQMASESLQRFNKGVEFVGEKVPPDLARGFFAFHGTSPDAIEPICMAGFDPSRRCAQVCGPGEYFGVTAAISDGYTKNEASSSSSKMMIIAFIFRCDRVTTRSGFCYVVNNPIDWSAAFNLPVAVVTYSNDNPTSERSPFTENAANNTLADTTVRWQAPFRWHWRQDDWRFEPDDDRIFEPYNDKINSEIEQLYEKWKLHNGPSKVITSPLVRYLDDKPQTYEIDFERNIQTNTKTSFSRGIERRAMNPSEISKTKNWFFRNEHHQWTPYESLVQQTIENAYQLYQSQQGPSTVTVRFPGRPESYKIDFLNGKQMNQTTKELRLISRI